MLSSRNFMVSGLMFKSNPFWVDFYVWCKVVAKFHSFAYGCSMFSTPYVKETVLFPLFILGDLIKNRLTGYTWVYFWVLCSVPLVYVSVFMPYYFDYCNFVYSLKSEGVQICSFSRWLWLSGIYLKVQY